MPPVCNYTYKYTPSQNILMNCCCYKRYCHNQESLYDLEPKLP